MKLIVAGATGLVGTEIIRQSLQKSEITQVIALARKPIKIDDANSAKLKNVTVKDYCEYSDEAKAELAGADACIWTVAVTPTKSSRSEFAEVKRVCYDCTMAGFKAIYEAGPARPFRFLYFSGAAVMDDPKAKKPFYLGDYMVMRSETDAMVRKFPEEYPDVEVCVVRPGLITNSTTWTNAAVASVLSVTNFFARVIPNVPLEVISAAVLKQAIAGFEKTVLSNADLVRLGQAALKTTGH